ncbi:uncharacterized protein LOC119401796 isoform X2 [Rhipicephalus sanguineus]|uniref:uncharacterized protein LOC119401796 isoform X2 n=1 Tax=Rhipicephalus sanguineus TaxID=34632 RepID=UPI00189396D2|nr:uncharacterized protein LOC119401796 isoform X2 [Rhipicephalus sanguineus]
MPREYLFFLAIFHMEYNIGSANERPPEEKIGENVTASIYVYYNSTYLPQRIVNSRSEDGPPRTGEIPATFLNLFKKVGEYFHNRSVMINFTVIDAETDDSIEVFYKEFKELNASGTLAKLIMEKPNQTLPPTNIAFYYTNATLMEYDGRGDQKKRSLQYLATMNTFCTWHPSAAVVSVTYEYLMRDFMLTIYALFDIFGIIFNSGGVHPSQKQKLKEQLLNCTATSEGLLSAQAI